MVANNNAKLPGNGIRTSCLDVSFERWRYVKSPFNNRIVNEPGHRPALLSPARRFTNPASAGLPAEQLCKFVCFNPDCLAASERDAHYAVPVPDYMFARYFSFESGRRELACGPISTLLLRRAHRDRECYPPSTKKAGRAEDEFRRNATGAAFLQCRQPQRSFRQ
jgi:hypothetical protein